MSVPLRLRPIPLFEPRWGERQLRARFEQDERSFQRGFFLRAYSDEEITFPSFRDCYSYGVALGEIQRSAWPKVTGVDLSGKNRPGNALVTVAVDPRTRRRCPVDVRFGAWKSHETCQQLADINRLYRPTVIMVEDNGYQQALIDWAQAMKGSNDFWMKIEPTTTTGPKKNSAELGLPALQVEFRAGAWVIPADELDALPPGDDSPWARWAREFINHPLAATTDGVMATWFARQGIEEYVAPFSEVQTDLGDVNVR